MGRKGCVFAGALIAALALFAAASTWGWWGASRIEEDATFIVPSGASVTSVAQKLEQEGLIVIKPHIGAAVRELPIAELRENLLIRSELEALAARLAAPLMTKPVLDDLQRLLDKMDACIRTKRYEQFGALNRQFHMTAYDVIAERSRIQLAPPPSAPPELAGWAHSADIAPLEADLAVAVRQFLPRANLLDSQARYDLGQHLLGRVLPLVAPAPPPGHHPESILRAVMAERYQRDLARLGRDQALRDAVLPNERAERA